MNSINSTTSKPLLLGILIGMIVTTGIALPVVSAMLADEREQGQLHGFTDGIAAAADSIRKVFGAYDGKSPYRTVFSVKVIDVVVVDSNGVPTIRVYE